MRIGESSVGVDIGESYNRIWCTGGLKEGGVPC